MTSCNGLKALNEWNREHLLEAIEENKWYLSEERGYDVGFSMAEMDFLNHHCSVCGARWRVIYCGTLCELRNECELGQKLVERDTTTTRGN